MKSDLTKFQRVLGYTFQDVKLLTEAVMHRSFASENNLKFDNQRMEFLGDSVMQIILTEFIFKKYPDSDEGLMTKIRSAMADQSSFARLARRISLGEFLMLGKGEIENGGADRDSTLSDAFESVIAAIFLDSSMDRVRQLVLDLINEVYPDPMALLSSNNPKGALQEYCQRHFGKSPHYTTLSVTGEDHDPVFTVQVELGECVLAVASAGKRKLAEGQAAGIALSLIQSGKISALKPKGSE